MINLKCLYNTYNINMLGRYLLPTLLLLRTDLYLYIYLDILMAIYCFLEGWKISINLITKNVNKIDKFSQIFKNTYNDHYLQIRMFALTYV